MSLEASVIDRPHDVSREPLSWTAQMIRPLADRGVGKPASFVSTTFELEELGGAETLHISALGLYRAYINGKRVGDDLLTPGWTCYDQRLSYQSYSVSDLLQEGTNTIDIWLADGWLRSQMMWRNVMLFNTWGDQLAAIAELRASPGTGKPLLVTDGSWESGELPIRRSGIYFGEIYDARVKPDRTHGTEVLSFDKSVLLPHEITPVHELEPLPAINQWTDMDGRTVYDFGQNCAGYVSIAVQGEKGARILVEHAEILDQDGQFYNVNFRTAEARLEYVLEGRDEEHYRPYFTFQGFRYARITIEGDAEILETASVPITSMGEPHASFECGNELANQLVQNTLWSQRSNFIEVPTDCPQRDERLGWTGDAQVFAGTACYLGDSRDFFAKFLRDVMADQTAEGAIPHFSPNPTRVKPTPSFPMSAGSTGWGDAISIIPWTLYCHYGDKAILRECFDAMLRWNDYVWSISDGPVVRPNPRWADRGFTFGDWLQPQNDFLKAVPTIGDDAAATIYLYISSAQIARIARLLGEDEAADRMQTRADAVKRAFQHEFITPAGRLLYDDQTSYALAFLHDLIPDAHVEAAKGYFKATIARAHGRIGTGFIGTPALLPALVKIGERELAGSVFLQEEVPGWLFQVKMGATSIWERWDGIKADGSIFEPTMNSYNHYAYGAVCEWLFEAAAGFRPDPDQPGFKRILFEPAIIPELGHVRAHHDSPAGRVSVHWTLDGERVTYRFSVPSGATAELRLADDYADAELNGTAITDRSRALTVSSGDHEASFTLKRREH